MASRQQRPAASLNTFHYLPQYLRRILKVRSGHACLRGRPCADAPPRGSGDKWTWSSRFGKCCTSACRRLLCACPARVADTASAREAWRALRCPGLCKHAEPRWLCAWCRYRHTTYHKRASRAKHAWPRSCGDAPLRAETKNQWARDDPAFVVITCALVAAAACAYCAACVTRAAAQCACANTRAARSFAESFTHTVLTVTSAVLVDYLLLGVVLATSGWCVARAVLRRAGG